MRPSRATWGESHPDLTQLLTLFIVHSPFSPGRHPPDYILTAYKPHAGKLVVGWVTTSESLLLYVCIHLFLYDSFGNFLLPP